LPVRVIIIVVFDLALQIIVFGSLGFIIYLMARALPRVENNPQPSRGPNFFERLLSKIPTSRLDQEINGFLARFLRKIKVFTMKLDNFINDRLGKLTKKAGEDKVNSDKQQPLE